MSESESEFYGLLRHNYTVDVRFTYLLSVSGNVGLFMVGLMRLHCTWEKAAMAFVLEDVIKELERSRSLEPLKKLKKKNLVEVAVHFGITPAVGATKFYILALIENYYVDNDIIGEVEEKPSAKTAEVLKLKLEFQREERR